MELTNDFRVGVPVSEAWKVLTDVERIAPFLPGAQLQEVEGDEYRGIVKIKVGPITAQYKGTAAFVEQDEAAGRVVLRASGRDTRGQGNATAMITATMKSDGDGTKVSVLTDLTITGKVAQFGRGVLADVSGKLIGQFVDALEDDLKQGATAEGAPEVTAPAGTEEPVAAASSAAADPVTAPATETTTGQTATGETAMGETAMGETTTSEEAAPGTSAPVSGPRKIDSPDPRPVDLLDAAGGSVAKRAIPVIGGLVALALVLVWRRRRKAKRARQAALRRVPAVTALRQLPGHRPDLRGHISEVRDSFADVRDHLSDVKDRLPEVPSSLRDLSGHLPAAKDVKSSLAEVKGRLPDLRGLPEALPDLPSWRDVASHLPDVPARGRHG